RRLPPPGPAPWLRRRSTPVCAATFSASGEAFTRPADTAARPALAAACAGAKPALPTAGAPTIAAGRTAGVGEADGVIAGWRGAGVAAEAAPGGGAVAGSGRSGVFSFPEPAPAPPPAAAAAS